MTVAVVKTSCQTNYHRFKANFHNSLDLAKGVMDAEDIQISMPAAEFSEVDLAEFTSERSTDVVVLL